MEPNFRSASQIDRPDEISAAWWNAHAQSYLDDSPSIGVTHFQWCPEGWTEDDLNLLETDGKILEIGAGSAPCSRWLAARGHDVTATDISTSMVDSAKRLNSETGIDFPVTPASISDLPYEDDSFDTAFTSFGAIGFIPDLTSAFSEVARVLRPGGQWVYASTHPMSWIFPDSPHVDDLRVIRSYGSGEAYVEVDGGKLDYAEFAHTVSDHINATVAAGFRIERVLEPTYKPGHTLVWGPWGPDRGSMIPGSLIISARLASM